jgi:hypothetical protein
MASTREQLCSEISFRDEVIRVSCLKGETEKSNELSPFMVGMTYVWPGRHRPRIVSALIQGITERPKRPQDAQHAKMSAIGHQADRSSGGQVTSADAALHHNFK